MKEHELKDEELALRIKEELDASLEGIDPGMSEKLRRARLQAVAAHGAGRRVPLPTWLTPVRLSFSAVAAVALSLCLFLPPSRQGGGINPEDLELLTAQEQPELIQDLDFYRWLALTKTAPEAAPGVPAQPR